MKFYGIDARGTVLVQRLTSLPTWDNTYEGRIVYTENNDELYIGLAGSFKGLSDVPSGEQILFYSDTAVTGYSLVTSIDDEVVYITKGSAAGGETGGAFYTGSTWTQPGHAITEDEMPSHNHDIQGYVSQSYFNWRWGGGLSGYGQPRTATSSTVIQSKGGGQAHNHGSTWRPKGRNFTLQERD